jgi:hypothetical protein
VDRAIVGFEKDAQGDWVALLECGHRQHVRHRPPWQERPWVLTEEGRGGHFGTPLECRICDEEGAQSGAAGGDPACWADRVCPACGAIGGHRSGCDAAAESAHGPGSS